MITKQLFVILFIFLLETSFGNANLSHIFRLLQNDWIKYVNNTNRTSFGSSKCEEHIHLMIDSLNQVEDNWAMRMFDSSTKLHSGYFQGNFIDFGHFDQCIQIRHNSQKFGVIKGQHCVVFSDFDLTQTVSRLKKIEEPFTDFCSLNSTEDLYQIIKATCDLNKQEELIQDEAKRIKSDEPKMILNLGLSVCLPASCSPTEVKQKMNYVLGILNQSVNEDYNQESYCSTDEPMKLTSADKAFIVFFSIIVLAMTLSTYYDVSHRNMEDKDKNKALLVFSVVSNGRKLFAMDTSDDTSKSDTLSCIHGIKALSIMWIVLGHRYAISLSMPLRNGALLIDIFKSYYIPLISGAFVVVDTFFVISGLLLSYIFLKTVTKSGRFNIRMFYIHRYLRITPPVAAMVFFQATVFVYFGTGPYWKRHIKEVMVDQCIKNWWTNLLYIHNYYRCNEKCLEQTWYLACDMQLFILSPLILIPLWKRAKTTVRYIVALLFISMIIIFIITYANEFSGQLYPLVYNEKHVKLLYLPTHGRFGPWLFGLLVGYLLHFSENAEVKMKRFVVGFGWIACIVLLFAVIYGAYPIMQLDDKSTSLLVGALFQSCSRMVWSLSVCWIIFTCTKGHGGVINWLLSLPVWQPISRLSFCIYLCHVPVIMGLQLSKKQTEFFSHSDMIYKFLGDFGLSFAAAALWSLAFESPVRAIENILIHKRKKTVLDNITYTELPEKNEKQV